MMRHPPFLDDDHVASALDEAADAAIHHLASLFPQLHTARGEAFWTQLRADLGNLLTGQSVNPASALPRLVYGEDAFGDRFSLDDLPLPRAGTGYAVQMLDTDTLLDRTSGKFLPVRDPALAGLFESFDAAHAAARAWVRGHDARIEEHPLAIVPAYFDHEMNRHVLVYGVLTRSP